MHYTLEAAIAAVMILGSAFILFAPQTVQTSDMHQTVFRCIENIDSKGLLRYYLENSMQDNISSGLSACLPKPVSFSLASAVPEGKTVFVTTYLLAGDKKFSPNTLRVWSWL